MRRRQWWQLIFLDGQASKLAGAYFPAWLTKFDTKVPLNLNDSDISPTMKELPQDKEGITEMLFCRLRYEVAMTLKGSGTWSDNSNKWNLPIGPELIAKKDREIDALEARFQERYIQHCDPSIPLHLLAIYMTRSIVCTMRLMAHHPRQYPDKGASMPQKEKDMLFALCLRELEVSSMGHENKTVIGFMWHLHVHFQLDAFIYLLRELRTRVSGELVDRAWIEVERAFQFRPEMLTEVKNNLYFAIGSLVLKAWTKREEAGGLYGEQILPPPRFISILRSQRRVATAPPPQTTEYRQEDFVKSVENPNETYTLVNNNDNGYPNTNSLGQWDNADFSMDMNVPDSTMADWEYYQTLLEGDLPAWQDPHQFNDIKWAI